MGSIGVVSFVPRQIDNHSKLDGGVESKSDQKKDGVRRTNTGRVSSDWRPDGHSTGEGDAEALGQVMDTIKPGRQAVLELQKFYSGQTIT